METCLGTVLLLLYSGDFPDVGIFISATRWCSLKCNYDGRNSAFELDEFVKIILSSLISAYSSSCIQFFSGPRRHFYPSSSQGRTPSLSELLSESPVFPIKPFMIFLFQTCPSKNNVAWLSLEESAVLAFSGSPLPHYSRGTFIFITSYFMTAVEGWDSWSPITRSDSRWGYHCNLIHHRTRGAGRGGVCVYFLLFFSSL